MKLKERCWRFAAPRVAVVGLSCLALYRLNQSYLDRVAYEKVRVSAWGPSTEEVLVSCGKHAWYCPDSLLDMQDRLCRNPHLRAEVDGATKLADGTTLINCRWYTRVEGDLR